MPPVNIQNMYDENTQLCPPLKIVQQTICVSEGVNGNVVEAATQPARCQDPNRKYNRSPFNFNIIINTALRDCTLRRLVPPPQTIVMSADKLRVSVCHLSVCAHRRVRIGVCGCRSGVCDGPAQ